MVCATIQRLVGGSDHTAQQAPHEAREVTAEFQGGPGNLIANAEEYGADKTWVIVAETEDLTRDEAGTSS